MTLKAKLTVPHTKMVFPYMNIYFMHHVQDYSVYELQLSGAVNVILNLTKTNHYPNYISLFPCGFCTKPTSIQKLFRPCLQAQDMAETDQCICFFIMAI